MFAVFLLISLQEEKGKKDPKFLLNFVGVDFFCL